MVVFVLLPHVLFKLFDLHELLEPLRHDELQLPDEPHEPPLVDSTLETDSIGPAITSLINLIGL